MSELPTASVRCQHLYCKSMIAYGENFESDPDFEAGMVDFWCVRTAKSQGPDAQGVALDVCRDPSRECYTEY